MSGVRCKLKYRITTEPFVISLELYILLSWSLLVFVYSIPWKAKGGHDVCDVKNKSQTYIISPFYWFVDLFWKQLVSPVRAIYRISQIKARRTFSANISQCNISQNNCYWNYSSVLNNYLIPIWKHRLALTYTQSYSIWRSITICARIIMQVVLILDQRLSYVSCSTINSH